jgi:hypothetical protein
MAYSVFLFDFSSTCNQTMWQCTDRNCPSTCQAFGDPHYVTFDGKWYEFQGACSYVMAQDGCNGGVQTFSIIAENVACGISAVSCTKSIKITIADTLIHLVRGTEPVVSSNPIAYGNATTAGITVKSVGLFVIVNSDNYGIRVEWDRGMRVYITLEAMHMNKVCGLCGNYDKRAENDFRARTGQIENNGLVFANSWRTENSCPTVTTSIADTCETNKERKYWASYACNIMKTPSFTACHRVVDVDPFYEACMYDSCGCDRGGDCECLCTAVAAYVHMCNTKGVSIKWRDQYNCRK